MQNHICEKSEGEKCRNRKHRTRPLCDIGIIPCPLSGPAFLIVLSWATDSANVSVSDYVHQLSSS